LSWRKSIHPPGRKALWARRKVRAASRGASQSSTLERCTKSYSATSLSSTVSTGAFEYLSGGMRFTPLRLSQGAVSRMDNDRAAFATGKDSGAREACSAHGGFCEQSAARTVRPDCLLHHCRRVAPSSATP